MEPKLISQVIARRTTRRRLRPIVLLLLLALLRPDLPQSAAAQALTPAEFNRCNAPLFGPAEERYVGWYGNSPANTPNPTYNGTPNLTATAIAGGSGIAVSRINEFGSSIIRMANVNSRSFAAAVANKDYLYSRITVNRDTTPIRLTSTEVDGVATWSGGSYDVSLVVVDLATNQSTTFYQDKWIPSLGNNIRYSGSYTMLPGQSYEVRWYVQAGLLWSVVRSMDNPALNFQAVTDCDSDGDGLGNKVDLDDDNDGIRDQEEAMARNNGDTDGDGIPDRLDLDSDNDGLLDITESGRMAGLDANGDGRLDGPVGADGIPDHLQSGANSGTINYMIADTDGDSHPDFQDLDSDNDAINDLSEAGSTGTLAPDANYDGIIDGVVNNDGLAVTLPATGLIPLDSEGDGFGNWRDWDSDNDAWSDLAESGLSPALDSNNDGMIDDLTDPDGDGIPAPADGAPTTYGDANDPPLPDLNSDGTPDYRELSTTDMDGDGVLNGNDRCPTTADRVVVNPTNGCRYVTDWVGAFTAMTGPGDAGTGDAAMGDAITNVALGKVATQSSTGWEGNANRAIDGNTDGNYGANSTTHTTIDVNPWWQVDLGAATPISSITLWNRTDCCSDRLSNFFVFVADNDMTGKRFGDLVVDPSVWRFSLGTQAPATLNIPVNVSGRYVRVQLAGTNPLSLAEVQIFTPLSGPSTGLYTIRADHSKQCIDVAAASTVAGANVQQWPCLPGAKQQQWQVDGLGNGLYVISNVNSGKVLSVAELTAADGTNIDQENYSNGDQQMWHLLAQGDGSYQLVAAHSNKCLDVAGAGMSAGVNIQQWSCHATTNQRFTFVPTTEPIVSDFEDGTLGFFTASHGAGITTDTESGQHAAIAYNTGDAVAYHGNISPQTPITVIAWVKGRGTASISFANSNLIEISNTSRAVNTATWQQVTLTLAAPVLAAPANTAYYDLVFRADEGAFLVDNVVLILNETDTDKDGLSDRVESCSNIGGLNYEFYDLAVAGDTLNALPTMGAVAKGIATDFDVQRLQNQLTPLDPTTYAIRYSGYLWVREAGQYSFATNSDDGTLLYVDQRLVVNNDGQHPVTEQSSTLHLYAGIHRFQLRYSAYNQPNSLAVSWSGPTFSNQAIPFEHFMSCNPATDTDQDGLPNYRDLDSDDDTIPDAIENAS